MSNLIALKPKPEGTPPKLAQQGTRMFRRSDVIGSLNKLIHYAVNNVKLANSEGRHSDADIQRARLRTLYLVRDAVLCIPEFENPAPIEQVPASGITARSDETAEPVQPEARARSDAQTTSGDQQ